MVQHDDPQVVLQEIFKMADEQVKAAKDILDVHGGPSAVGIQKAQVHAALANYYGVRAQIFVIAADSQLRKIQHDQERRRRNFADKHGLS